jgi:hypothetical protein
MPKEVLGESYESPMSAISAEPASLTVLRGRWRIINNIVVQSTCRAA